MHWLFALSFNKYSNRRSPSNIFPAIEYKLCLTLTEVENGKTKVKAALKKTSYLCLSPKT